MIGNQLGKNMLSNFYQEVYYTAVRWNIGRYEKEDEITCHGDLVVIGLEGVSVILNMETAW